MPRRPMLRLELKLSLIEFGCSFAGHVGALFALKLIALPLAVIAALGIAIGGSLIRLCLQARSTCPKRIQAIVIGQQQSWLQFSQEHVVTKLPQIRFFSEFLIVLDFVIESSAVHSNGEKITVLLLPDSLSQAEDCRLRRYLRFDCPD